MLSTTSRTNLDNDNEESGAIEPAPTMEKTPSVEFCVDEIRKQLKKTIASTDKLVDAAQDFCATKRPCVAD